MPETTFAWIHNTIFRNDNTRSTQQLISRHIFLKTQIFFLIIVLATHMNDHHQQPKPILSKKFQLRNPYGIWKNNTSLILTSNFMNKPRIRKLHQPNTPNSSPKNIKNELRCNTQKIIICRWDITEHKLIN